MARHVTRSPPPVLRRSDGSRAGVESYDKKSNKKFYYDEEAAEDEDDGRHNGREHRHRTCALLLLATAADRRLVASHPTFGRLPTGTAAQDLGQPRR